MKSLLHLFHRGGEYTSIAEILEINNSVKPRQQFMIMCDRQQRGLVFFHCPEQLIQNARFIFRIQVAGGFIGQNQPGLR